MGGGYSIVNERDEPSEAVQAMIKGAARVSELMNAVGHVKPTFSADFIAREAKERAEDEAKYAFICGVCWGPAVVQATYATEPVPYHYCTKHADIMKATYGDRVTMADLVKVPQPAARMVVVSGPATVGVQGIPTTLVARTVRLCRGTPSGYGYQAYTRRGWRMRTWWTTAAAKRYRRDAISDL